jgi:hypothetical protein
MINIADYNIQHNIDPYNSSDIFTLKHVYIYIIFYH